MSKEKNTCFEYKTMDMWHKEIFCGAVTIDEIQRLLGRKKEVSLFIDEEFLEDVYVMLTDSPATVDHSIHELYSTLLKHEKYNIHGDNEPKTLTLRFFGQSDDTFGEYCETYQDIDNFASGKPIQCIVDCKEYGRLLVVGQYSPDLSSGCWVISVGKVDDMDEFPDWKLRLKECQDVPYSMELEVEIPNCDFELRWYNNGKLVS